ncbi:MAG: sugar-binding protein [Planctomycetota bacterium]
MNTKFGLAIIFFPLMAGMASGWELKNPSFEEGNWINGEMEEWTRCGTNPDWVEVFVRHAGIEPRTGQYCIGSYSGPHRTRWGGAYQRIEGLKPGYRYRASVWFYTDSYDHRENVDRYRRNCRCRLGFDPTGSTDDKADTVVWSHPRCTKGHKWECEYWPKSQRKWSKLEVEAVARGTSGTIFLESGQLFGYDYKINLFDDADLQEIPIAMTVTQEYPKAVSSVINLKIKLANRDNVPVNGKLELKLPNGMKAVHREFSSLSKNPSVFNIKIDAKGGNPGWYEATLVVLLDSGRSCWRRFNFHVPLICSKSKRRVRLDANLDEWRDIPGCVISKGQAVPLVFSQDCRGLVKFQWDDSFLYMSADVEDDDFIQDRTDTQAFSRDSIDILIDVLNDSPPNPTPSKIRHGWGPNDHEFLVALTPEGPRAFRWKDVSVMYFKGEEEPAVETAISRDGLHTIYEIAIPWSSLSGVKPKSGQTIGIDVAINDKDQAGDWKAIGLAQAICGNAYRRPHNCADMILTSHDTKVSVQVEDSILFDG